MTSLALTKDENQFLYNKLKMQGYASEEIKKRKKKIKEHLRILVLKEVKKKNRELTKKEKNLLFKEEYAKMIENSR